MGNDTINFILFVIVVVGGLSYFLGQLEEANRFNEEIRSGENNAGEDILNLAHLNMTGKEKVESIKESCKKEFPNKLTSGSWIFKISYSAKDCETNFINKIVIEI